MDFFLMTLLRLLVPLAILRWPFAGAVLSMLADGLDWHIIAPTGQEHMIYQSWDKLMDMYYLTLEMAVVVTWQQANARKIATALYGYRLLGFILFEITHIELFLFFFPNLFESFFLVYMGFLSFKILRQRIAVLHHHYSPLLFGLLIPKLGIEYYTHLWHNAPSPFTLVVKSFEMLGSLIIHGGLYVLFPVGFYLSYKKGIFRYLRKQRLRLTR